MLLGMGDVIFSFLSTPSLGKLLNALIIEPELLLLCYSDLLMGTNDLF